jgi:hypothetical protein
LLSDHTVVLRNYESARVYPDALRRVRFHDAEARLLLQWLTIVVLTGGSMWFFNLETAVDLTP